jgi:hypothetical protein
MINGETVIIEWKINGYAPVINSSYRDLPITSFDVSNSLDDPSRWPHIDPTEYNSKILQRLGLEEKFLAEFPLQIPAAITAYPSLPPAINGMQMDLNTLVTNLKNAVKILRNSRSTNDYRQVMDQVKTSVDAMRKYIQKNKTELAKEIFIDTGVIANVDPGGGDKAAEDVVEKFGVIMENIYQISSKPAHVTHRPGQPPGRFNFVPESSDAEFVLTIALASARYLMDKIEAYTRKY